MPKQTVVPEQTGGAVLPERSAAVPERAAAPDATPSAPAQAGPALPAAEAAPLPAATTAGPAAAIARSRRLAMTVGIFNLLWVAVTVLMIVRPGSTTGV
ncbi:conserved hypothetical protein [Frankia canadensis]|uniref:Uncharacterized protein n=1 Tax=Frankia canadensis TaxID=1836972 RepID=A0A2I2KUQ1_9ACTN|nr:conserved hypothetical protein [Frankia canadensis]SOU56672.1 conserved hypothetical protein [Frankia canadensis]